MPHGARWHISAPYNKMTACITLGSPGGALSSPFRGICHKLGGSELHSGFVSNNGRTGTKKQRMKIKDFASTL